MKQTGGTDLHWINLNAQSEDPLFAQLITTLRGAILSTHIPLGARLPSSRNLAIQLGISRNTVISAFEQLIAEGYLVSKTGAGTEVVKLLPEQCLGPDSAHSSQKTPSQSPSQATHKQDSSVKQGYLLSPSSPDTQAFPHRLWKKCANSITRQYKPNVWMNYGEPAGFYSLRESIAKHLSQTRGIDCSAQRILITSGSQQALDLCSRILLKQGDTVHIEDPCYQGAIKSFQFSNAQIQPIPVDNNGIMVDEIIKRSKAAALTMVTPSHQYPLGSVLSLERRLKLLDWAQTNGSWIIEDDYGGELRYEGRPLMPLQGLDTQQRVLYIGSFSKTLFPALRLGYLVLPDTLVDAFTNLKAITDGFAPLPTQMQLNEFIQRHHYDSHIRKMRTLYAARQHHLLNALNPHQDLLHAQASASGMHLIAKLDPKLNDKNISLDCAKAGLYVPELSKHYHHPKGHSGLLLGFASTPENKFKPAISKLVNILKTNKAKHND